MSSIFAASFAAWIAYAARQDWRDRRVTNTWIALGLALGVALDTTGGDARYFFPAVSRLDDLMAFGLGLLIMLPAFAIRAVGASDVKILAVLGLWTGVHALMWTWAIGSVLAMLHSFVFLYLKLHRAHSRRGAISGLAVPATRGIPFVSYLAVGAIIALISDFASSSDLSGALL